MSRESGRARIAGFARPGFEAVREAFLENFERRKELGAACCVYYRGEKVVDLWGGIRRNFEVPAGGGVGTARAMAHVYGVFATGGKELGLREETLRQLMAPPSRQLAASGMRA
jgi:hypothetical protein